MVSAFPVSVVICTRDRAAALRSTLQALDHQLHEAFEVIVVADPGDDGTRAVLDELGDRVRVVDCTEHNLSRARNLGIDAASGGFVAFLDDDALPTAGWLSDLTAALEDRSLAGAGGVVLARDGFGHEYRFSAIDRIGRIRFDVRPPFAGLTGPGRDEVLFLPGTNACFRRQALVAVGGFDDAFDFGYDAADLCRRLADAGLLLTAVDGAAVIHRALAGRRRSEDGRWLDPRCLVRARALFARRHAGPEARHAELSVQLDRYLAEVEQWAITAHADGRVSRAEHEGYVSAARLGLRDAEQAAAQARREHAFSSPPATFRAFAPTRPEEYRRVCFVSRELPPSDPVGGQFGGVARYSHDLALGFADAGHEVHLITGTEGPATVTWEDRMWVHRLPTNERGPLNAVRASLPATYTCITNAVGVWHEVQRILAAGALDLVAAPLYLGQGLVCSLDDRVPVITTLHTTFGTVASMHPSWTGRRDAQMMLNVEQVTMRHARNLHALTRRVLADAQNETMPGTRLWVEGIGSKDGLGAQAAAEHEPGVGILFVGRLERRKGADTLLTAFEAVHARHPEARLTIAGPDTPHTEINRTYREAFADYTREKPELAAAVRFVGAVSDERLATLYRSCDIVCAPSRYESFGLVSVEGMSFGKPIVACDAGGTPEVVRDDQEGLLVAPDDPGALADALTRLLEDHELRGRLGAQARRRFATTFDLPVVVGRLARVYGELAELGPGLERGEPLVERLAGALIELGVATLDTRWALAHELLDPRTHPVDRSHALTQLSNATDDELAERVSLLLLGRPPTPTERGRQIGLLRSGVSRDTLVRGLAADPAALRRGGGATWLPEADLIGSPPKRWKRATRRAAGRAVRTAYRAAQRSGIYPVAAQLVRAQIRTVLDDTVAELRSASNRAMREAAQERRELEQAVRRVEDSVGRLDSRVADRGPGSTDILALLLDPGRGALAGLQASGPPQALTRIDAEHVLDRVPRLVLREEILPHWHQLLASDGELRVTCLDWTASLARANGSEATAAALGRAALGEAGAPRRALYGADELCALLEEAGFAVAEVTEHPGPDGVAAELEVLATRRLKHHTGLTVLPGGSAARAASP